MVRVFFLVLLAAAGFAQGLGKWKLNLENSKLEPGAGPASENIANLGGYSGNVRDTANFGQPQNRADQVFGSGGRGLFNWLPELVFEQKAGVNSLSRVLSTPGKKSEDEKTV